MTQQIRSLLPPGGFSNLVGHYVAALDVGSAYARASAMAAGDAAVPVLEKLGALESAWVHSAIGDVPTPDAPADDAGLDAWLGWLDAVRTVSIMVLRPLQDRDLERLIHLSDDHDPAGAGPARTVKLVLAELNYLLGSLRGKLEA